MNCDEEMRIAPEKDEEDEFLDSEELVQEQLVSII